MKRILGYLLMIVAIVALIAGAFLAYIQLSLPKYSDKELLFTAKGSDTLGKDTLTLVSWNIGYCGLGSDMDFFYDGGTRMRTTKPQAERNLAAIRGFLSQNQDAQFFLIQEIDTDSKRSYEVNQVAEVGKSLTGYQHFYAENYAVKFVPRPLSDPLGKISSGVLTASRYTPHSVVRHSYPDKHPWPTGLFMPKRCFLETRYRVDGVRDLVVVNTHNSAYDDGNLRQLELEMLRKFALAEYQKGNWVVVGGDWNQNPPGYVQKNSDPEALKHFAPKLLPANAFPSGWTFAWDRRTDSNRFLNEPYTPGKTMTTTIDLFLLSPNVELLGVEIVQNGFAISDHQPLKVKVLLKNGV